jgi:hypothetical protein
VVSKQGKEEVSMGREVTHGSYKVTKRSYHGDGARLWGSLGVGLGFVVEMESRGIDGDKVVMHHLDW